MNQHKVLLGNNHQVTFTGLGQAPDVFSDDRPFSDGTNVDDVLRHMLRITAWATDPACPAYLYVWHVWSRRYIFNQSRTAYNCLRAAADREWEEHPITAALITICGRWQLRPETPRFSLPRLSLVIFRPEYLSWKCLFSVSWLQQRHILHQRYVYLVSCATQPHWNFNMYFLSQRNMTNKRLISHLKQHTTGQITEKKTITLK